ncbi:MAG: S-layer protein, partial [Synergistaceae bacterium]|nr:S-layer protein [Synergistaceae bacterium]
ASILARSLSYVDLDKASKADVEMMRRLVVEFSDELAALGVKVDTFDGRLGVLESDLGGWKLSGVFEFNAKFGQNGDYGDVDDQGSFSGLDGKTDFDIDKYRIFLDKRINDTTSFHARIGKGTIGGHSDNDPAFVWEFYYITTKLGYDITLDAGRFEYNWEDALGLVADDDVFVGKVRAQQFRFSKDWGLANLQFVLGRVNDDAKPFGSTPKYDYAYESLLVAGLADFTFNEKLQAGLMAYYTWSDQSFDSAGLDADLTELDLGVYAKLNIIPSVEMKGVYYYQDRETATVSDNFSAWKGILTADQDLLRFTDLQIEYAQIDNLFRLWKDPYDSIGNDILSNRPYGDDSSATQVIGVRAAQKWGESRWDSWVRYYRASYDVDNIADAQDFGLGIGYQLNPAVHFELAADYIDFGNANGGTNGNGSGNYYDEDIVVRFQTVVNF